MKIIATIFAIAIVSIAGTYAFVTSQKTVDRSDRTESASKKYEEQISSLRSELNAPRRANPMWLCNKWWCPAWPRGHRRKFWIT